MIYSGVYITVLTQTTKAFDSNCCPLQSKEQEFTSENLYVNTGDNNNTNSFLIPS